MTDITDRAAVVDAIIAERPYTITLYRRSGSGETALDPFTGRIDEMGVSTGRDTAPGHEGTIAVIANYILLCSQGQDIQAKDRAKAEDENSNVSWYNVLHVRKFPYKVEALLVARDSA
jgi:hypothetical protein